jgi:hypothetical protein
MLAPDGEGFKWVTSWSPKEKLLSNPVKTHKAFDALACITFGSHLSVAVQVC